MTRHWSCLALMLLTPQFLARTSAEEATTGTPLVGAWRVASVETVRPNGESLTRWMGKHPTGLIVYLASGLMSVQIMRDPRPVIAGGDFDVATLQEKVSAIEGYYAYWGTYDVDTKAGTVTHHVEASLNPDEVGLHYKRTFELVGDHLTLTTPLFDEDGEKRFNRLRWDRVK